MTGDPPAPSRSPSLSTAEGGGDSPRSGSADLSNASSRYEEETSKETRKNCANALSSLRHISSVCGCVPAIPVDLMRRNRQAGEQARAGPSMSVHYAPREREPASVGEPRKRVLVFFRPLEVLVRVDPTFCQQWLRIESHQPPRVSFFFFSVILLACSWQGISARKSTLLFLFRCHCCVCASSTRQHNY